MSPVLGSVTGVHRQEVAVRSPALHRAVAAVALMLLAGCGADNPRPAASAPASAPPPASAAPATSTAAPAAPAQLPQGGTRIFPTFRVVAYYGTAGNSALGVLGDRKIQVAYELIASVAQAGPGKDGDYSQMIDLQRIQQYVDQAKRNKVLVILDL